MPDPRGRFGGFLARLRLFVPAVALSLVAGFLDHPVALFPLLVAQPLYACAAVSALGYLLDVDFGTLALRRGTPWLALFAAYTAFVALVVGTPTVRLLLEASPLNALLLSGGIVLAVLVLWRLWPTLGLVVLWDDAYPDDEVGSWIITAIQRASAFARHLTAARDPHFGRGLPVAIGVLLLAVGGLLLAGLCGRLPSELRWAVLWVHTLLVAPAVHLLLAYRCEQLLLDDEPAPEPATADPQLAAAAEPPAPPAAVDTRALDQQLLAAAAANQIEHALLLLAQGAHPDARAAADDRDQRSLLQIAATCPDLRLLRELLRRGAEVNRPVGGITPLIAATRDSYQGRPEAVMTLVTNGADPRALDSDGNSALHYAALSREATVAAILLDAGADPNAINRDGLSPLAVALAAGNETLARYLLEHGALADPPRGVPALIAAAGAADDLPGLVRLLTRHKADLNARDRLGRSALHSAALAGHAELAEALLAAGADVDARDSHGITPLMEAVRAGHNRVLQRLVFRKPKLDPVDPVGRSALVIACQSRQANEDSVRLLLALGADPDQPTREGKRAIDYALAAGRWPLVTLIDPSFALPEALLDATGGGGGDDDGEGAEVDRVALLAGALKHERYGVAAELLAVDPAAAQARAAVALALADAHPQALRWLLEHGLATDASGPDGAALAITLLRRRPLPAAALAILLERAAAVGGWPLVALLDDQAAPAEPALEPLALALLERGADAHARDAAGRSALQLAVRAGAGALVAALLARGHDPNAADAQGRTALHELAALGDAGAVALAGPLLRAGADPERPTLDAQTPLGAALAAGRMQLARRLSWTGGFRHPARPLRDGDLPGAATLGDTLAVERLLELGLPVDGRDAQGCSALLRACGGGRLEIATTLLVRGADPALAATTGATCLSAAVSARHDAIVNLLLDRGAAVDQRLPGGSTALLVAAALGLPALVRTLLGRGADPRAHDEHGNGALHAAAQFAFGSLDHERCRLLLQTLLGAGAPADAPNALAQTPLLLLLGARVSPATPAPRRPLGELMALLLARGADVDAQDARGVSALHAAAMHGQREAIAILLQAGANPTRRDHFGRTAHDVALMLGYADVAGELARGAPAPSALR
jgi:hypothetical protein